MSAVIQALIFSPRTGAKPTGTFSASPTTLNNGFTTLLTWTSSGATSASIDHGIGSVTPVAGGNNSPTPPVGDTVYTITFSNAAGDQQYSTATVHVRADLTGNLNPTSDSETGSGNHTFAPANVVTVGDPEPGTPDGAGGTPPAGAGFSYAWDFVSSVGGSSTPITSTTWNVDGTTWGINAQGGKQVTVNVVSVGTTQRKATLRCLITGLTTSRTVLVTCPYVYN